MPTLPQLYEEDIAVINRALDQLIRSTEASVALVIDKGGFLISHRGESGSIDTTSLAALAAGSFAATQTIASIVNEPNFSSLYQQGEQFSLLVSNIDDYALLAVVFRAGLSVGAVKYYAASTIRAVGAQHLVASQRTPEGGLDLSMLNMADTSGLFQRRTA
ncbi:MAG: roadblock/LC7 domain-containing protein [Verrucomicrobia bacterium]|nr:roadblock/LC7 domain-containing protein [Verrucomicrobiota bacterium]MBI3871318.1 roadblock/LC7 domain-containing protein [Verrucomicrobiota bacterium]